MPPSANDVLRIGAQFDVGTIQAGMAQAADAVEQGTARMNTRFNRVGTESQAAMNKVAFSSTEARHALHGLGEEMGVHIPRFVQTFVAHMGGIGPLLASAFSAIAIVGLLQVLAEVPEAIDKIIGKFSGWDAEAKKTYQDIVQGNIQLQIENLKLLDQMDRIALIGKTGSERSTLSMELLGKSTKETGLLLGQFMRQRRDMEKELERMTTATDARAKIGQPVLNFFNRSEIEEKKKGIEALTKAIDELEKQLHAAPVKQKEAAAQDVEARIHEAQEYRDILDRMYTEETKLSQQAAAKELRDVEKLAADRERLNEELEKSSLEMAKKDLADFERVMVDKTRLQEDEGKFELEQIRARYEEKSKLISAENKRGGEALTGEAFRALDQETTKIAQLIGLEEQLRQKLIAVGNAETDPKVQESLRRQQDLVQQANIAWQKYQGVVTNVAVQQEKEFRRSFDAISNEVNRNLISWMAHQETFGRAAMKIWDSLATTAINSLLRIAEQELIAMALHKSIADAQKLDDAKAAARGAFKWVMETIPFPLDLVLAPAAAAAAFAGVMAFEQGGIVPRGGLAMLHPQEMVLPAPIAQKVQNMAGGGHSGPLTVNFHGHQDMAGMENRVVEAIRRAQRRGRVTAP